MKIKHSLRNEIPLRTTEGTTGTRWRDGSTERTRGETGTLDVSTLRLKHRPRCNVRQNHQLVASRIIVPSQKSMIRCQLFKMVGISVTLTYTGKCVSTTFNNTSKLPIIKLQNVSQTIVQLCSSQSWTAGEVFSMVLLSEMKAVLMSYLK